jgi:putative tryptophan/tyrosine transport system substrate-binding protein
VINRRTFLCGMTLGTLLTPLAAEAQQDGPPRLGFLGTGNGTGNRDFPIYLQALRDGLVEFNYVVGQNVVIDYRWAEEKEERLPALATELVEQHVVAIVTPGPSAIRAARRAGDVPIIAIDFESDPVAAGYAASFARPGGNVTGVFLDQAQLSGKWLELLKEAVPRLGRVAVLWDATTPPYQLYAIKDAAKVLALKVDTLEVRRLPDLKGAFDAAPRLRDQGVVLLSSPLMSRRGAELAAYAMAKRLPTISLFRENAAWGCLMSYGPSLADGYRRLGALAGRILNGTKPADLPIEQPNKFELVINLKTAKALGLTIPQTLLLRADQLIE